MRIDTLLSQDRTLCNIECNSKRDALAELAKLLANSIDGLNAEDLQRRFLAREKLGSTGIGHGIAIPHCRLSAVGVAASALITLAEPVDFESIDDEPVDILFAMLVPEDAHDEHLKNLAELALKLSNTEFRQQLRDAESPIALFEAAIKS